jgi:hypothetical protein
MPLHAPEKPDPNTLEEALRELRRASHRRRATQPGSREHAQIEAEEERLADAVWRIARADRPDTH